MVLTSMCPEFVLIDGLLTMERVVLELFFLLCGVIFRGVGYGIVALVAHV